MWVVGFREAAAREELQVVDPSAIQTADDLREKVTVVLDVDAPDDLSWDKFAGVGLLSGGQESRGGADRAVIAISRRSFNDLLPFRLIASGATHLVSKEAFIGAGSVCGGIEIAVKGERLVGSPRVRAEFGLRAVSNLNAGLQFVRNADLTELFEGDLSPSELGLSRRRMITLRSTMADVIGVDALAPSSGSTVGRILPSWRQLVSLVNIARGLG